MIKKEFGEFIKQIRIDRKLTLRDIGLCLGKSATYISDVENGRRYAFCQSDCQKLIKLFNLGAFGEMEMMNLATDNWAGLLDEKRGWK